MKTLAISEIEKVTEVLEMTQDQVDSIKKQFTSVIKLSKKTVIVKDWLDDSIQIVKVKESNFRCSCCEKLVFDNPVFRDWTRGTEVGLCQKCDQTIENSKWKTVTGYLNNN